MPTVLSVSKRIRVAVFVSALAALAAVPTTPKPKPPAPPTWAEVDRLVDNQKLAEATRLVDRLLEAAKQRHDEADWTRALVRGVQLRIGLHGYETAVRFLKEQPWPSGLLPQTTLDLFYGQALVQYERVNSWEIGRREKVESAGAVDVKLWTRDQILEEVEKAYRRAWDRREALGGLPVGALSEYVEPNDYPNEVRGTLRDAVSYLFVELLADSALWTPAESAEVWTLDVPALLAEKGADAADTIAGRDAHPVAKLVAVLADLEEWHGSRRERAGELEARLERVRRLHAAFPEKPDRAEIERSLEALLPRYRDDSWWAMGMVTLATLREAANGPDDLVRAREAAVQAFEAYPRSPGGRRANEIVARIEAPEYALTSMSSDGPDRPSIQITHKNLSSIYFRAYRIDFDRSVEANFRLTPGVSDLRAMLRDEPEARWEAKLAQTPDFRSHLTYSTPPMHGPGGYTIIGSAREDFAEADNAVSAVTLVISDLVLVTRPEPGALAVRVVSGSTGTPVSGADVSLWLADGTHDPVRLREQSSDSRGLVRFVWAEGMQNGSLFLVGRQGGDAVEDRRYLQLAPPPEEPKANRSLVYTDRAVYRPSQKILWKVVAYGGDRVLGRLHVAPDAPVTMSLVDANGETVGSTQVVTNGFGSAAGEFLIPPARALGHWSVVSSLSGHAGVQVEEYKRPTFEVRWEDPRQPLRLNQPAVLRGTARYYFGSPVTGGTVRWAVRSQPQLPEWWWRRGPGYGAGERIIASGTANVGADGTFEASFTPKADERLAAAGEDLTYIFEARADVTDEGGETRLEARSFRLGFVSVQADVRMDEGFLIAGSSAKVLVVRTDRNGAPAPGAGRWRLLSVIQPRGTVPPAEMPPDHPVERFSTPGDRVRARWDTNVSFADTVREWKDGSARAGGEVAHDAAGRAEIRLPTARGGSVAPSLRDDRCVRGPVRDREGIRRRRREDADRFSRSAAGGIRDGSSRLAGPLPGRLRPRRSDDVFRRRPRRPGRVPARDSVVGFGCRRGSRRRGGPRRILGSRQSRSRSPVPDPGGRDPSPPGRQGALGLVRDVP